MPLTEFFMGWNGRLLYAPSGFLEQGMLSYCSWDWGFDFLLPSIGHYWVNGSRALDRRRLTFGDVFWSPNMVWKGVGELLNEVEVLMAVVYGRTS